MPRKIDISHKTVIFIAAFILSLWIIYLIKDLLLILFVAVILMSALSPLVNQLVRFRIPKVLSIGLAYGIIILIVSGLIVGVIQPLIEESSNLIVTLPDLAAQLFDITHIDRSVVQNELANISRNAFSITLAIFDNILTIIFLLVITFYLLLERESLEDRIAKLFIHREDRARKLMTQIEEKLGAWFRGQLVLSLIIGVMTYIGLTILNIPYALSLSIFAGVMEVVPVIGPIISAIPALLIALTFSPLVALGVTAMYFVIQQLENNLIVPQVMKRAVGLNPLVVILAIAIGSRLLGVAGALLAVPILVVLQIIVAEIIEARKL